MSRYLTLLAFVALPALLAACDAPKSPLAKAKPGECYTVVGRDSLGKPTLAKTPCAASTEALAATCPPPTATVGCPQTAAAKPARKTSVGQMSRNFSSRQTARRETRLATGSQAASRRTTYARQGVYAERASRHRSEATFGDYQRIYTPAPQELYGAPPPPAIHAEPAPQAHAYGEERYAERRAPHGKGEALIDRSMRQSERSAAYSYSESSSSSSSSSYSSSSGGGHGRPCCVQGALPPSPFDRDGYLTWRGKTPR